MAESELIRELHANLWSSLRHVFNRDRVLIGVLYVSNCAGFVMLASVSMSEPTVALVTVVAIILFNCLILLSLNNSKKEVLALIGTLIDIYNDYGLSKYFDHSQVQYYRWRYALWMVLVPIVAGVAIALGLMIGLHR